MKPHFEAIINDITPLGKIYHCANIDALIRRMENSLAEIREKAPQRKDYIEGTEHGISDLQELRLWIENLYSAIEVSNRTAINSEIARDRQSQDIVILKTELEKLGKTLEFNEK